MLRLLQCVFLVDVTDFMSRGGVGGEAGTHREGSWTRSLRLMPLRSSARFRKQLSLTGTTNGRQINTRRLTKASLVKSAHRNVPSFLSFAPFSLFLKSVRVHHHTAVRSDQLNTLSQEVESRTGRLGSMAAAADRCGSRRR